MAIQCENLSTLGKGGPTTTYQEFVWLLVDPGYPLSARLCHVAPFSLLATTMSFLIAIVARREAGEELTSFRLRPFRLRLGALLLRS